VFRHATQRVGATRGVGSTARVLTAAGETSLGHWTVGGHVAATLARSVHTNEALRTSDVGGTLHAADSVSADLSTRAVLVGSAGRATEARRVVAVAASITAGRSLDARDLRIANGARWTAALHAVVHYSTQCA